MHFEFRHDEHADTDAKIFLWDITIGGRFKIDGSMNGVSFSMEWEN